VLIDADLDESLFTIGKQKNDFERI
jgi:hypothetical protein